MAESAEIEMMQRYASGASHDIAKYANGPFWLDIFTGRLFLDSASIKNKNFFKAKNAFFVVQNNLSFIMLQVASHKSLTSKRFKEAAAKIMQNTPIMEKNVSLFLKSKECPKEAARQIAGYLLSFSLVKPLASTLGQSKLVLKKKMFRVKPLIQQLQNHVNLFKPEYRPKVSFTVQGNPSVYADPLHFRRAVFNIFHDAITHSSGELIQVNVRETRSNVVFSATNVGRKIATKTVKKIGKKPYTIATEGLLHGFGKVVSADIAKAHGGSFRPRNSS